MRERHRPQDTTGEEEKSIFNDGEKRTRGGLFTAKALLLLKSKSVLTLVRKSSGEEK